MKAHQNTTAKKTKGFSLVEIMVAMVIGLLGTIVIFQVFAVSEKQKRTTVSGGDAQQNGAIALFSIEQDARMGGYGLNYAALIGCPIRWYRQGPPESGTEAGDPPLTLTPIVITQGVAAGAADTITVTYGNSDIAGFAGRLTQEMPNPAAVYKVNNRFGYNVGDLVVASEVGKDCTLAEVTGLPGGGSSDNVIHNSGGTAVYNRPAGLGISYTTSAVLINLGPTPTVNVYSILDNRLAMQRLLQDDAPVPIVDGIVQLQARYGRDTTLVADGVIDVWDSVSPTTADGWSRVLGVRIAVVARSGQRDNAVDATGVCTTTTALPQWVSNPLAPAAVNQVENIDVSIGNPNWRCYRYKTFQTSVPIRNMIWRPL